MDIDKPLDEIIASKPRSGGRRKAQAPRAKPYSAPRPAAPAKAAPESSKIIISNLPSDVTEAAVRDLMQSTVGPVKSLQMSYNATGKSTGSATVIFRNKGDANKAHAAYHNRMIDNQRPLKVEIAVDLSQMQSLASRVAPAATRGTSGPRRGAGRGAARPKGTRPTKKTAEELDADMAAYKDGST